MNPSKSDDPLSVTLADWRVAPPRDPQFRAAVWGRIEGKRGAPTWSVYLRAHAALVAGALAVAVVAGSLLGRGEARARVEAERTAMVNDYVQSLDARAMRMP